MPATFVRTVRAFEGEVVDIRWTCADGDTFTQRVTIPPKVTRAERLTPEATDVRAAEVIPPEVKTDRGGLEQ